MEQKFYHLNIECNLDSHVMLSPDVYDSVLEGAVQVSVAPTFENDSEHLWSPEHLFAASVSTSILRAFFFYVKREQLELSDISLKSTAKAEKRNEKYKVTEVIIVVTIGVESEYEKEIVERMLLKAKNAYLASETVSTKITLRPFIEILVPAM